MKIALSIPGFGKIDSPEGLPQGVPTGGLTTGLNIIWVFIILITIIAILVALWFVIRGGFDIIQSRGQKEKLNSGRERVIYALFGLIMIFLSFVFMSVLSAFFGANLLPFNFK